MEINFRKTYYHDGKIKYIPISKIDDLKMFEQFSNLNTIKTGDNVKKLRFLAASDFHIGNSDYRPDSLANAFNYCVINGIHIIMCSGDLLDGTFTAGNQIINDPYEQMRFFIENYPHDESILTFAVGGDHDLSLLKNYGIDVKTFINNIRNDVIIPDYNSSIIRIKNDSVLLYHHIDGCKYKKYNSSLILHGHSHEFKVINFKSDKFIEVCVPSLSDIISPIPIVLDVNLDFLNGHISNINIKQIMLANKPVKLGEYVYKLSEKPKEKNKNSEVSQEKIIVAENSIMEQNNVTSIEQNDEKAKILTL